MVKPSWAGAVASRDSQDARGEDGGAPHDRVDEPLDGEPPRDRPPGRLPKGHLPRPSALEEESSLSRPDWNKPVKK